MKVITSSPLIGGKSIRLYGKTLEFPANTSDLTSHITEIKKSIVYGGILSLHSAIGFPYDLTLEEFNSMRQQGHDIKIMPYDLMFEILATGLYDIGEEIGSREWKEEWEFVQKKMHYWAATHFTMVGNVATDEEVRWRAMIERMRQELASLVLDEKLASEKPIKRFIIRKQSAINNRHNPITDKHIVSVGKELSITSVLV